MSNKARRLLVLLLIILKEAGPTAACSSSCLSQCYCSRGRGLTSVPQDVPTTITWLDLRSNAITNITDIFEGLGNLKWLYLNSNDIRRIEAGTFNDTTQLSVLDLSVRIDNNPWQCDCRMLPFRQRMNGSYPFEDQMKCAGPGNLAGQFLRYENPEDLIFEYDTIAEINQQESPHQSAGNMQHLGSYSDVYEIQSPSLGPENGAHPQARQGPQSNKYENSQVIAAAAKDAAAGPQVIMNEDEYESVDNQSQTAAAPGADSPNHYEPLRNPSGQQQHTYTSLLPRDSQHH
ncbi:leucine-rich repeat and transmembrane domain-containing protein 2-like [Branchiostoma floridae]|uniref:Leucine-rich repeat and transmembrane domain-containing protein 2-like n=1 Tax=Branchiostoma floridae TaxID=7739 RepID=A0A9J7MDP8_BRAFL|nr:leucine-rich repeat and transmembrane domain-containing protein 2-like [Branchiostoma floridae]